MPGGVRPFLSIIVPFHNSVEKCRPLLRTLRSLGPQDGVELILVDDASADETRKLLTEFAQTSAASVLIVERKDNGGPGAARNSGLERAAGEWVWFVDSDDDIDLSAIALAKARDWSGIDLIAWDWEHPTIRRAMAPGLHKASDGPAQPDVFDPIVTNWLSRDLLDRTRLRFPEYCVHEATPIEAFILPLLVGSYFKSEFIAYRANTDCPSVTRGAPRYDRLATVSLGMDYVSQAQLSQSARGAFEAAFIRLFLWYSIRLSKVPGRSWLLAARVMRQYRDEARRFGISRDPFDFYPGRGASRLVSYLLWRLSALLPPQDHYFKRLHETAWGRPIGWTPPTFPGGAASRGFRAAGG